jgi:hypothetical protein
MSGEVLHRPRCLNGVLHFPLSSRITSYGQAKQVAGGCVKAVAAADQRHMLDT